MPSSDNRRRQTASGRRGRSGAGARVLAWTVTLGVHLAAGLVLGLQAVPLRKGGEAPVINLSLEPSPRFDSQTPPNAESATQVETASSARSRTTAPQPTERLTPRPAEAAPMAAPFARPIAVPAFQGSGEGDGQAGRGDGASQATDSASSTAGATQGGGGRVLGAEAAPSVDAYAAEVLAWIERHKRHPGGARGVVTVRFELDRNGRVHRLTLARSSGVRALDRAALDQIAATQPFPRPPAGTTWTRRPFTVNIDYRVAAGR